MSHIFYVEGDLFAPGALGTGSVFIPHVCNNRGAWGAGFVLPLAKRWPETQAKYSDWYRPTLGQTQFVTVQQEPTIVVCNMVAQTLGGQRPLYYNHLAKCMDAVANEIKCMALATEIENYPLAPIHCPMFGSGLAGGDWLFVEKLIEDCWVRAGIPVVVHYLRQFLPSNFTLPKSEV